MEKQTRRQLILHSLLHFCVDWACVLLVSGPVRQGILVHADWLWCILLYNAAAFALQLPLGALLDGLGGERRGVWLGCLLVALGWLMRDLGLWPCLVAGVGNALFHLGGGSQVLAHSDGKAGPSGIFVSTGALGVWLGSWCAQQGLTGLWLPVSVMALGAVASAALSGPKGSAAMRFPAPARLGSKMVWGCLFLFFTVCLRAWAGGLMSYPWQTGLWSLLAVLCVAGGKAAGGLLGDRFGFDRCAWLTLLAAAVLFLFAPTLSVAGLISAFLFNTSMPLTLTALAGAMGQEHRGLAFGLTTFAIFWGTVPGLFGALGVGNGALLCGISLASAGLLLLGLRWAQAREGAPC